MATIIRVKPTKSNKEIAFVGYVRSYLTVNYAILIARAKNDMLSNEEIINGVSFEVIDKNFDRHEFYHLISEAHLRTDAAPLL